MKKIVVCQNSCLSGKKTNPVGKLWDKYCNQKAKRARLLHKCEDDVQVSDSSASNYEFDETVLLALKTSLSRDISN